MGNKPVSIGLKIDKSNYEAGSVVKGTVYVKIASNSNDRVTGVHLTLDGEERVSLSIAETYELLKRERPAHHESYGDSKSRRKREKMVHSYIKLVGVNVPIAEFTQALSPGEYEYPFEWELPQNLPPSMYVTSQGRSAGVVHYQITAFYSTDKKADRDAPLYLPHQSATQKIQILPSPSPLQSLKAIQEEDEFSISSCCCFPKGKIQLAFHLDRGLVSPGSRLQVRIAGRNFSEVPVSHLEVTLLERVKWTAGYRSLQRTYTLAKEIISTSDLPHWQCRRTPQYSRNGALLYQETTLPEPLELRLWVPSLTRVSYKGKLLEVTHALVVRAVTLWYVTSPTMECPVKVGIVRGVPSQAVAGQGLGATTVAAFTGTSTLSLDAPVAEADVILPADWRGQAADIIFIPPTLVMVDDGDLFARPPSVVPTAPDESLLQSSFSLDFAYGQSDGIDDGIQPCDFTQLQTFLSNVRSLEELPNLLPRNPPMLARIRRLTPRQFVILLCHPESHSNNSNLNERTQKKADDICRGRILAGIMGDGFQCRHVLASLWGCPEEYRLDILREVAPLASDWATQRGMIARELEPEEADYARIVLQWNN